jgi:hypothetical protein
MMKKVLLVVLTLAIATSLSFAQTSGPSNVAGYVKITCGGTVPLQAYATPFGLPFKFWDVDAGTGVPQYGVESFRPSDIIGDQANPGGPVNADRIVQQSGTQAYRDANNGDQWTGTLEDNAEMFPGWAYWFVNKTGTPRDLVLAGEVDNSGNYGTTTITAPTTATNYATPYSWCDSRNVPVENLGLIEQGFLGAPTAPPSDKVVQQGGTGYQLNYIDGVGWDHGFDYIEPGLAYWIVNKHSASWDYTYVGVPSLPSTGSSNEGAVTGAKTSPKVKSKATVRAISGKKSAPKTPAKSTKTSK